MEYHAMLKNISFIRVFVVTENSFLYFGVKRLIEIAHCFKSQLYTVKQTRCMPEICMYAKSRTFDIVITDNYFYRIAALQKRIKNTLVLPASYDVLTYLRCFDTFSDVSLKKSAKVIKQLSLKENVIFSLFSSGIHDDMISTSLSISKKTVSAHRRNILGKLKLKNRHELYLYAFASHGEPK